MENLCETYEESEREVRVLVKVKHVSKERDIYVGSKDKTEFAVKK